MPLVKFTGLSTRRRQNSFNLDKMTNMPETYIYQKLSKNTLRVDSEATAYADTPEVKLEVTDADQLELKLEATDADNLEVKLEATDANQLEIKLEATDADAKNLSQVKLFPQYQVFEAIQDARENFSKNTKKCIRCNFIGQHLRALVHHVIRKHKDLQSRWCRFCNGVFDNLTDHVAMNHTNYVCKFCSKKFLKLQMLIDHLRSHSDVNLFRCSFCNERFIRPSALNVHVKKHTKEKPYKCDLCNKSFTQRQILKTHLKIHKSKANKQLAALELTKYAPNPLLPTTKPLYKCTYCDKKFKTNYTLVEHKRTHKRSIKPYVCQVCEKSFVRPTTLKTHMIVHNVGNKKTCNICDKKFCTQEQLRVHLQGHTGEKPFVCAECGKAFIGKAHLAQHVKTHTDLRPFQCNNCNKSFKLSKVLKQHMLIHSEKKLYKCNQCSYASHHGSDLTKHIVNKHEFDKPQPDRPHVCLMCNRSYTTNAMLMSHINTHSISFDI